MPSLRERLNELGLALPKPARSVGRYAGHVITGNQFWCVQGPVDGDDLAWQGRVGRDYDLAQAQACARFVMLNILTQLDIATGGDMDRIVKAVRLGGYIAATEDFDHHTLVMNGASELLLEVLGERGRHTRFVVGCTSLPYRLALEIEAVIEIRV
jgi:enamine deaminase RidA (YjgF/YER057c/UK114 family)